MWESGAGLSASHVHATARGGHGTIGGGLQKVACSTWEGGEACDPRCVVHLPLADFHLLVLLAAGACIYLAGVGVVHSVYCVVSPGLEGPVAYYSLQARCPTPSLSPAEHPCATSCVLARNITTWNLPAPSRFHTIYVRSCEPAQIC